MPKDLYAILGLQRGASNDDIKKAYRKLSKEWHPDKHKGDKAAEERFKEINEAYEVLTDAKKREMYDQFGTTGGPGGPNGANGFDFSQFQGFRTGDFDFGDIFQTFFGGGRGKPEVRDRGDDREVESTVSFADAVTGVDATFSLKKMIQCALCHGSGTEPGASLMTCATCGGTGQVVRNAQSFFGTIRQQMLCPDCGGSGKIPEKPCSRCSGEGRIRGQEDITVHIPAGIADGQTLKVTGKGDAGRRGGESGDLYVRVLVRPDPRFERIESDIRSQATIPALDAILGRSLEVETVHGPVTLQIPEGTQPGQIFRIKGKGMPVLNSHRTGDHYVKVEVEIPKKLNRSERSLLEEWRKMR